MINIVHVWDVYGALNSLSNILQNVDNERLQKFSLLENILTSLSECL